MHSTSGPGKANSGDFPSLETAAKRPPTKAESLEIKQTSEKEHALRENETKAAAKQLGRKKSTPGQVTLSDRPAISPPSASASASATSSPGVAAGNDVPRRRSEGSVTHKVVHGGDDGSSSDTSVVTINVTRSRANIEIPPVDGRVDHASGDIAGGDDGSVAVVREAAKKKKEKEKKTASSNTGRRYSEDGLGHKDVTAQWNVLLRSPSKDTCKQAREDYKSKPKPPTMHEDETETSRKWDVVAAGVLKGTVDAKGNADPKSFLSEWETAERKMEQKIMELKRDHVASLEKRAVKGKVGFALDDSHGPLGSAHICRLLQTLTLQPCPWLVLLNLSNNKLVDILAIVECLETLPQLLILKLERNKFTDVNQLAVSLFGDNGGVNTSSESDDAGSAANVVETTVGGARICTDLKELWLAGNPIDDKCMRTVCNGSSKSEFELETLWHPNYYNCKTAMAHLVGYRDRLAKIWSFALPEDGHEYNHQEVYHDLADLKAIVEQEGKEALQVPADQLLEKLLQAAMAAMPPPSNPEELSLDEFEAGLASSILPGVAEKLEKILKAPPPDQIDAVERKPRATEIRLAEIKLFLRLYVQAPLSFCTITKSDLGKKLRCIYTALVAPCVKVIQGDMQETGSRLAENSHYEHEIRQWAVADETGFKDDKDTYSKIMDKCRKEPFGGGPNVRKTKIAFWNLLSSAWPRNAVTFREKTCDVQDGVFQIDHFWSASYKQPVSNPLDLLIEARKWMPSFNKQVKQLVPDEAVLHLRPLFKPLKHFKSTQKLAAAHIPGTKGLFRMIEKSLVKKGSTITVGGDPNCDGIRDVYGCLIECNTFGAMATLLDNIRENKTWEVLRIKNRLGKGFPFGEPTSGGWEDIMINVREITEPDAPKACIFEIQIANSLMLHQRKAMKAHTSFVAFRGFDELMRYKGLKPLAISAVFDSSVAKQIEQKKKAIEDMWLELKGLEKQKREEDAAELKELRMKLNEQTKPSV